jgi:hypothetical protein
MDRINDKYGEFAITPALMMGMDDTIIDRIAFGGVKELEELYHRNCLPFLLLDRPIGRLEMFELGPSAGCSTYTIDQAQDSGDYCTQGCGTKMNGGIGGEPAPPVGGVNSRPISPAQEGFSNTSSQY